MARIFLTGATGYIGGEVIQQLAKASPAHQIRALVRDVTKAQAVANVSARIEIVHGDLDDTDIITKEALEADLVLHLAATGHLKSVEAIYQGLSKPQTPQKPRHWIQISGATALAAAELADRNHVPGSASDVVFNDVTRLEDIRALLRAHPGRAVDNFLLSAGQRAPAVKTALIFGPIIYGEGTGPVNQRSVQIPSLAKATLQRNHGLQVGSGLSRWGNIHVADLGRLIVGLTEAAVQRPEDDNLWGQNGLYLAGVGEMSFGEISKRVAAAARDLKLAEGNHVDEVQGDEANTLLPHGNALFGTNARGKPGRAALFLGWAPTETGIEKEIPRAVVSEAKLLELL